MKNFLVLYIYKGKPSMATCQAKDAEEAKAQIAVNSNIYVEDVIQLAGSASDHKKFLKTLVDFKGKGDGEIQIQNMSDDEFMQSMRNAAAADNAKEQDRKSKFKKYSGDQVKQLDPDKKEYLLKLADEVMNTDKDFRKDVWKKLLEKFVSPNEVKAMQKEFEADAKKNWKSDKANLKRELEVVRRIFSDTKGKWSGGGDANGTLTFDEIATSWGCSKPYVIKVYQQAMKKLIAKLLKKDTVSDEEVKMFQAKINDLNKEARRIAKDTANGNSAKAAAAEKKARNAEKEFNRLLKDLNDVRKKFKLPKIHYYARQFAPKDAHLDAYEKPPV